MDEDLLYKFCTEYELTDEEGAGLGVFWMVYVLPDDTIMVLDNKHNLVSDFVLRDYEDKITEMVNERG